MPEEMLSHFRQDYFCNNINNQENFTCDKKCHHISITVLGILIIKKTLLVRNDSIIDYTSSSTRIANTQTTEKYQENITYVQISGEVTTCNIWGPLPSLM